MLNNPKRFELNWRFSGYRTDRCVELTFFMLNWRFLCVELTGVLNGRFFVVNWWFFGVELTHWTCWTDGSWGLKRSGPCVELMCWTELYSNTRYWIIFVFPNFSSFIFKLEICKLITYYKNNIVLSFPKFWILQVLRCWPSGRFSHEKTRKNKNGFTRKQRYLSAIYSFFRETLKT